MKLMDYYNETSQEVTVEEIGKAGTGYNSPTLVKVNGVLGYKKKSVNCGAFDAFEYLISILGKELKIKMADTYLFDDDLRTMLKFVSFKIGRYTKKSKYVIT